MGKINCIKNCNINGLVFDDMNYIVKYLGIDLLCLVMSFGNVGNLKREKNIYI